MYYGEKIAIATIAGLQRRYQDIAEQLYFAGTNDDPVLPFEDSPIKQRIMLLCDVANGHSKDEHLVRDALLVVMTTLKHVPTYQQHPEMQAVIQHVRLWLNRDDLITLTEAAMILRGASEKRDLISINGYIKRGKLTAYTDPHEPNPTRSTRVSRKEVEFLRES